MTQEQQTTLQQLRDEIYFHQRLLSYAQNELQVLLAVMGAVGLNTVSVPVIPQKDDETVEKKIEG